MALQTLATPSQRIGRLKGEILAHAQPREVLGLIGETRPIPKNAGDTVIFRRWLPGGATVASPNTFFTNGTGDRTAAYANQYLAAEGITPNAETLIPQDTTTPVSAT